jgi:hypothetical protein
MALDLFVGSDEEIMPHSIKPSHCDFQLASGSDKISSARCDLHSRFVAATDC